MEGADLYISGHVRQDQSPIPISSPTLPIEVWERVIDWIPSKLPNDGDIYDKESRDALYASALVCRTWTPRSRHHLYASVELSNTLQAQSFLATITHCRFLPMKVRALVISPSRDELQDGSNLIPGFFNWIYKSLVVLPPLLTNLLTLAFRRLPVLHPSFVAMASQFKAVRYLRIESLVGQSFSEIIRLVNRLPHLRQLRLEECGWPQPAHCYPSKRHRFEEVRIQESERCTSDVLNWMSSARCLSSLDSLTFGEVHLNTTMVPSLDRVLSLCTIPLRYLSITFGGAVSNAVAFPSLNHLPLECLNLWEVPLGSMYSFSSQLCDIISPTIEIVQIRLDQSIFAFTFTFMTATWKDIDDQLSGPNFKKLSMFVIWSKPHPKSGSYLTEAQEMLQQALPKLYQRGIVWWGDSSANVEDVKALADYREVSIVVRIMAVGETGECGLLASRFRSSTA